jgi:GGDEF domain-containing protein
VATWITAAWLEAAARPFAERFVFPTLPPGTRDRKTGLPFFSYFDDLAGLFASTPELAASVVEVAFLDLAGFRSFNNAHGQDAGDAVLSEVASSLRDIPAAVAVRDGGDEFLVLGAPTRRDLEADLDAFRRAWPARFRARFGDHTPVVSRILVTACAAAPCAERASGSGDRSRSRRARRSRETWGCSHARRVTFRYPG